MLRGKVRFDLGRELERLPAVWATSQSLLTALEDTETP
jgi:hypothetical protein